MSDNIYLSLRGLATDLLKPADAGGFGMGVVTIMQASGALTPVDPTAPWGPSAPGTRVFLSSQAAAAPVDQFMVDGRTIFAGDLSFVIPYTPDLPELPASHHGMTLEYTVDSVTKKLPIVAVARIPPIGPLIAYRFIARGPSDERNS